MNRIDKINEFIRKGYTVDFKTGKIFKNGKEMGSKTKRGYIHLGTRLNGKPIKLRAHHFVYYCYNGQDIPEGLFIDHINGIRDDNRITNLRVVTNQENHFNRTTTKGYYWSKHHQKYKTQIMIDGKSINLGSYETEEEARTAYLEAKKQHHIIKNN